MARLAMPAHVIALERRSDADDGAESGGGHALNGVRESDADRTRPTSQPAAGHGVLNHQSKVLPWHEDHNPTATTRNAPVVWRTSKRSRRTSIRANSG
jgi:hypothetical protein